jgi:RNA polymerase sigma-70 factor, ECF subfamily
LPAQPPSSSPSDPELLIKARRGDESAFHRLMDRHADRLFRLACSLVGSAADAEEVVQETFLGAFAAMGRFRQESSVRTWLTRICFNQAAALERRGRLRRTIPLNEQIESTSGKSADARLDVMEALDRLSAEHREVIVLRELERLSYSEISAVLQIPSGTVESRLHRARIELRDHLKAYLR